MEWGKTDLEVVQCWLAFKELLRRKVITFGIGPYTTGLAQEAGWKNKWDVCTDEYFLDRILNSSYDFRRGHDEFGFDVMNKNYHCLNPGDLPRMLAGLLGKSADQTVFDPREVAKEMDRLSLGRVG